MQVLSSYSDDDPLKFMIGPEQMAQWFREQLFSHREDVGSISCTHIEFITSKTLVQGNPMTSSVDNRLVYGIHTHMWSRHSYTLNKIGKFRVDNHIEDSKGLSCFSDAVLKITRPTL